MANDYFTETGDPITNSQVESSPIRALFTAIGDGFDKVVTLTGNGGKIVGINAGGTAQEALSTTGTGNVVLATSPSLTTPNIGTPSAGTLTSCTGLPVSTGISGLGTGIATSLATNIGTAGSPVVNGGVLGTPSSGDLRNCSLAVAPVIGNTTPAAATFTTITATGNVTLGDSSADTLNVGNGGLIKDASGNIGVGTTPSSWRTDLSFKAIEMLGGAIAGYVTGDDPTPLMVANAYVDAGGSWRYIQSRAASMILMSNGIYQLYSAPAGTAGNVITWTIVEKISKDKSLALQGAVSQSGTGITFPSTQNASSDANTLDDYEEGTWTVVLYDASTGGNASATTGTGYYTKIGNKFTVNFSLNNINTGGMTPGNTLWISLPFTISATVGSSCCGTVILDNFTYPAGVTQAQVAAAGGFDRCTINGSGSGIADVDFTVASISSGVSDIARFTLTSFAA